MNEIKLYKSPWKAIKVLVICIPFVVIGISMITSSDSDSTDRFMGWFGTIFFGLGIPIGLFHLFDKRPQIIINELGIFDRMTLNETINWEFINDVYLAVIPSQKIICLVVNKKYDVSKKMSRWYGNAGKLNKASGLQEVNIVLGQIKIDEERLMEFILAMSKVARAERRTMIRKFSIKGLGNK